MARETNIFRIETKTEEKLDFQSLKNPAALLRECREEEGVQGAEQLLQMTMH